VKTISLKKVSAVAVASLGFGLLSAVPAFAETAITMTVAATLPTGAGSATAATATGAVGTAVTFTVTGTAATPDAADTVILTPVLTGTAKVNAASAVTVASTKTTITPTAVTTTATFGTPNASTGAVTATLTAVAGAPTVVYGFTPDVPGTYIYTINTTAGVGTPGITNAAVTFTYTATMTGAMFLTTGNTPAPVAASVTSGSALVAVAGGFAKFTLAQGQTTSLYNITATGMSITGSSTQLNVTTDTTQLWTPLNGLNVGGGVQWAPASIAGYITITVASTVAGTGTLTVAPIGSTGLPGTPITGTVTWGSPLTPSAQYSLVKLLAGAVATDVDATTADTTATTVSNAAGTQRFTIEVETNDQNASPITLASMTATITGPGLIGIADSRTVTTATGRSLTVALTGAFGAVSVWGDGSAGVSTISIVVTNSAGVSTSMGSKTVTFVGSAAKATSTQNLFVAAAATQLGISPTTTLGAATSVATTPALTATVTDAAGNAVVAGSATVKVVSSNSAVITAGTCVERTVDGTSTADVTPTPGVFECSVSGATAAISGQTATIQFQVLNGTTGLYDIVATPVTFTIGGAIAKVVVSTDKTSYDAGAAVNLTATATDSSGNKAYDGQTPYLLVTSNKTFGGTLPATTKYIVNGKQSTTSSTTGPSLYAPATTGSFTITGLSAATDAAPAGTAYAVTGTVTDANAALVTMIDALNAKIVALNALIAKIMKKLGVK
jgi:hypothetical protein